MSVTLVLPDSITLELTAAARLPVETAGVLLTSVVRAYDGSIRLLGREMRWVAEDSYIARDATRLSVASEGYVPALGRAEVLLAVALWVHTHPGQKSSPAASKEDDLVDRQIADLFRLRSGSEYYGALILSPRDGGFAFSGFMEDGNGRRDIARIWIVGDRFRLIQHFGTQSRALSPLYDRNVRAFGPAVQGTLGDIRVAVVGCGGTGSSVAEQLVRLGVRKFTLVDPKRLSESNVTRVYGSTPPAVGELKAVLLSRHIAQIAPGSEVDPVTEPITLRAAAMRLANCDLVFGCTDDNAGRLVLSRLPTYLLLPVIDCGILLSSHLRGELQGIDGRVTVVVPGGACLVCRGRIDLSRASSELLDPEERSRRVDEGYAPALPGTEPAVVPFTTMVAATAVSELLERLIGYGPEPRPSEVLLRCHEREISTNVAMPQSQHYCDPHAGKMARGMTEPFLEQTWAS